MFRSGVKIFSAVSCWFRPRLVSNWEPEPVVFKTVLDDKNPSARYVTVSLNRRAAKSLRCRFYFADVWMMFSEISFQSGNADAAAPFSPASDFVTSFSREAFLLRQRTPSCPPKRA